MYIHAVWWCQATETSEVLTASIILMTTLNMIISCSGIANCANTVCVHLFHINVECKPYVKKSKSFFSFFLEWTNLFANMSNAY